MKQCYAYLVIDCTPQYPSEIKVRADFFPGQLSYTFDISKKINVHFLYYLPDNKR